MALSSTSQHFSSRFSSFGLSLKAMNFYQNGIPSKFKKPVFIHIVTTPKTQRNDFLSKIYGLYDKLKKKHSSESTKILKVWTVKKKR